MLPKLSLPNLASLTGKIEDTYENVEGFFSGLAKGPAERTVGLVTTAKELVARSGAPARKALFALLCEEKGSLYNTAQEALKDGAKSAVGLLAPLLIAQFALAPALAVFVATLAVKVLASQGAKKLCAELAEDEAAQAEALAGARKSTRKPGEKQPAAQPTKRLAQSKAAESAPAKTHPSAKTGVKTKTTTTVKTQPSKATSITPTVQPKKRVNKKATSTT